MPSGSRGLGHQVCTDYVALLDRAQAKAPMHRLVSIDDVGLATAYLATDAAKLVTGQTLYIDGGRTAD